MTGIAARFNDGNTLEVHDVTLSVGSDGLHIVGGDSGDIDRWPIDEIELVDDLGGDVIRLSHQDHRDARVTVAGTSECRQLRSAIPGLAGRRRVAMPKTTKVLAAAAVILVAAGAIWFAFPFAVNLAVKAIPLAWDQRVGDSLVNDVAKMFHGARDGDVYCASNHEGLKSLTLLVRRLSNAARLREPAHALVVDSPIVNAVALPGGNILVMGGLLKEAQSANEVAGVLAHEIAHVRHRHTTKAIVRSFGTDLVTRILFGDPGTIVVAARFFNDMSHSRADEAEADATGIKILTAAGLPADGLADFFERMQKKAPSSDAFAYLATHPPDAARAAAARHAGLKTDAQALSAREFRDLQRLCD